MKFFLYLYLNEDHLKAEMLGIHVSFGARNTDGNMFCNYSVMSLLQLLPRQYQNRDKGVHVRESLPEAARLTRITFFKKESLRVADLDCPGACLCIKYRLNEDNGVK